MFIKNSRMNTLMQIISVIILGFLVYGNSITGKFIYDDSTLIKYNNYIKNWSNLSKAMIDDIGAGSGNKSNFSRPVQIMSYMLDYSIWKLNAIGYHITNIILHILVSLCIFWMVSIFFYGSGSPVAFLASLFYLVHPVHTETVAYISGRADSLAALFVLLCVIFYVKAISSKNGIWFLLILLSYILALFSKEYALITPALLLLYSYSFKQKLKIKEFVYLLAITAIYITSRLAIFRFTSATLISTTLFQRLPGFFIAIAEYARLLLLPFNLHMGYANTVFSFYEPRAVLGLVLLLTLFGYAFLRKYNRTLLSFSICWFFVALLPQSNLYPINAFMAEHWLYLPSLGFFLVLASGLTALYNKSKYIGLILIMGLLVFYSYFTIKQNNYWREPISFYKRYLRYNSNNSGIYYNLGINLEQAGLTKEAISAYRRVLEITPKDINTYYHLSNIYCKIKNTDEAVGLLKRAIEIAPGNAVIYYWLGDLYNNIYKTNEAIEAYNKAIQIDKSFVLAYIALGKIFDNSGDKEKAVKMFNKAITLLEEALEIEPDFALGHANLAAAYYYAKQYVLAIKHCDKAIQLGFEIEAKFLEDLKPFRKKF